jgi:serine/threonine protein kinase/tetratricopeptide (TPR) repeat protein
MSPEGRATDSARWAHVNRVFHGAVGIEDTGAREVYLQAACVDAPDLLAEVRSLLDWDRAATDFLEAPMARVGEWPAAAGIPPDDPTGDTHDDNTRAQGSPGSRRARDAHDPLIGATLGSWRITAIIGRGGMGSVYRAERADAAFERQVAIKVVRVGRESARMIERFYRERATLAALDHPNIARLLDGGATSDGQPYFVMEFVDGVPIDRYCDEVRLTIDQRLDLWRAVCAGVQYAHEHLIVHRDIKPDNILVSRDGTPKLLDFGIATLLSDVPAAAPPIAGDHGDADAETAAATWLMTPDYASPEQLFGNSTPRLASDVYSLGVLLYVLLTGVRPYRLGGPSRLAVQQQFRASTLQAPSARVAPDTDGASVRAEARGTTPRALSRRLAGDLDAIVLRALGRDQADRYSTVDQLALDLEHHRTAQPVSARGRDLPYLTRTFVRRHALALGVLAGLFVAAIGVMSVIVWQARVAAEARSRAERRFEEVRRLAHTFMFDVHDAVVNIPGTTNVRMLMVQTAAEYLQRLAGEAASDRDLQRELAEAFVKVGDAQGQPTSPNVGDTSGAIASYRRAIEIADALVRQAPDDLTAGRTLALARRRLADVLAWRGDTATALTECEMSARLFAAIASRPSPSPEDRLQAAIADIKLGDLLGNANFPNLGRPADAEAHYDAALRVLRPLSAETPRNSRVRRYLGLVFERIGTMHEQARRWSDAAAAYRDSFEIRQALAAAEPTHTDIQRDAAIAYEKIGNVERFMNDTPAAAKSYRGALARFEQLAAADPFNVSAVRTVAISQEKLGNTLLDLRQPDEARRLFAAALKGHRALAARDTGNAQARCDVARVAETLGDAWIVPASGAAGRRGAGGVAGAGAAAGAGAVAGTGTGAGAAAGVRAGAGAAAGAGATTAGNGAGAGARATAGARAAAGAAPEAACEAWREGLRVRQSLKTDASGCAAPADLDRVSSKLRVCR